MLVTATPSISLLGISHTQVMFYSFRASSLRSYSAAFSSTTTRPTLPRGDSFLNTADQIQDRLLEDGHRIWGFAVYRCTYRDNAAWETCLERLNASTPQSGI
jgi:hypothetical protein